MNNEEYIGATCELIELERIRNFIKLKAMSYGMSEDESTKVALAVDEACTNLIKHTFKLDKSKEFYVSVEKKPEKIVVSIFDNGVPFDPLEVQRPDMEKYFGEFKRDGLGIHLMRSVMDDVEYYPANKNRKQNVLKLIKNFNS
jgi:serine/threonine-protein kinase RsbW